jgi:hypothetical protein
MRLNESRMLVAPVVVIDLRETPFHHPLTHLLYALSLFHHRLGDEAR